MTAPIAAVAERVPPQSLEAEQSTLGSMLLDKEAIAIAAELLVAEDFYRESHRVVFDTLIELFNRGEPADLVTVTEALKAKNALEQVGGALTSARWRTPCPLRQIASITRRSSRTSRSSGRW